LRYLTLQKTLTNADADADADADAGATTIVEIKILHDSNEHTSYTCIM
jgi:hypothetical protein